METVTGFEPALMELQSIAFPLGYTVIVGYMLQFRYYCRERKQTMLSEKSERACERQRGCGQAGSACGDGYGARTRHLEIESLLS